MTNYNLFFVQCFELGYEGISQIVKGEINRQVLKTIISSNWPPTGASVNVSAVSSAAGQRILATPQKICRSISKAVGKKLAENNFSTSFFDKDETSKKKKDLSTVDDPYYTNVGPKFDMIASATLTLDECSGGKVILFSIFA